MEEVTIIISRNQYNFLIDNDLLPGHSVKEIYVKDELFKDDQQHKELVKRLVKAKEALKEYEFKKRNNIL